MAREAERKKKVKYTHLSSTHHFVPVAIESLGVFGPDALTFFRNLGRRIRDVTAEPMSHHFLIQRVAVAVQQGNAAAILGSFSPDLTDPFLLT